MKVRLAAPIAQSSKATYQMLVVASALIFLVLPFVGVFNEFLTSVFMATGLYTIIEKVVAPLVARMAAAILQYFFGAQTAVFGQSLVLHAGGRTLSVYINWNCVGWQSLFLLGFTLFTGLHGPYTRVSKALCVAIGVEGTILLNLARIVLVILVALFWGYLPSLIFHNYVGTLMLLIWLVAFWNYSFGHILERVPSEESSTATP